MSWRDLRRQTDEFASNTPLFRKPDEFGLRHVWLNRIANVLMFPIIGLCVFAVVHSVLVAVIGGLVLGAAALLLVRQNHRRRLANGTSASYPPVREREDG